MYALASHVVFFRLTLVGLFNRWQFVCVVCGTEEIGEKGDFIACLRFDLR